MQSIPYVTKFGVKQFKPRVSYDELNLDLLGFCLSCGNEVDGVEPDARRYKCEVCGQSKVYGLAELVIMNLCMIEDDDDDDEYPDGD